MTDAHDAAMDLIQRVQAHREAAGLKVTWMVKDEPDCEPRPFTAYAKDAEQAARWREKARAEGTLVA